MLNVDIVTNTNDSGVNSLRYWIAEATPGDTIDFASGVTGTITLTSGPLPITQDLDIEGPGADSLTISGNGASQVFQVDPGVTATVAGLTIADARSLSSGGGIGNDGTLALSYCIVSGNSANGANPEGGAIFNSGTLTVTNSTLSGNSALYSGGGIWNVGTLTVANSTLSDNSAAANGGGILNGGTLTVTNSTISGNSAIYGGGIVNDDGDTLMVTNSTISGNSSSSDGGGIYSDGTLTATNSTISGNSSSSDGGGIDAVSAATLANTIIAGNTAPTGPDVDGAVTSLGFNLIGNSSGGSGFVAADLLNVDPLLGPLQNNGGPTETMALLAGSPAIDAGSNSLIPSGTTTDQRGDPRDVDGVDIGAFEVQVYLVYSTADSGGGSLRAALANVNQDEDSVIAFTTGGVIVLASPLPAISRDVQILGPGANVLTISGNGANQAFVVNGGVTATIGGLTIADGFAPSGGDGGGIDNSGTLTLANSTLSGNSAAGGGGIENFGTLTVADSTLSGNSALYTGGGIENDGTLTVANSTLSGNSAGNGGGIVNGGTLTVTNSTLAGNSATDLGGGGGIYSELFSGDQTATLTLANTIIAGNTAPTGPDVNGPGTVTSLGYNLIGDSSGGSGFVATDLLNVNPLLGPLQYNGGPTETMALLPGSPAIGAGSVALAVDANGNPLTTDQRGSARTVNNTVDIGAFESRRFFITVASGNNQQTAIGTAFAAPLVVTVSSVYGEPVAGGVVTCTAPGSGASAAFPGGSNTATINASGQASIVVAANTTIGSYTLSASIGAGGGSTSFDLANTLGAPAQLVIHTQPSTTATAGHAFATQPVIYELDQYGNLETGDNSTQVMAALESGSGALLGTFKVTVSGGIATFTNLADNTAGTISLLFGSAPVLTPAISNNISISPAQANKLVIHTQPSATATAGQAFATRPVIYEEDQYGDLETGDNSTQVMAALESGSGALLGTLMVTVSGGIATFTNLADNTAGTISLLFGSAPVLTPAISNNISVSPAQANKLVIHTQPSATATAGQAFAVQPVIYEEDQYGNLETGDTSTQVMAALESGSGALLGTLMVTVSGGIATFTNLADNTAGTISLLFSSAPVLTPAISSNIAISPAQANKLVIHTQPSATATAGQAFAVQPVIYEEDQYGNLETGDNSTQVMAALESGSGALLGTLMVTVSGGIATFTNLADNTAGTISLLFGSAPLLTPAISSNIAISPAQANKLVIHTQPSATATAGQAFAVQPVIYEEDQYGNLERGDNSTRVTVGLKAGTGPLHGTTTVTVAGGIAGFSALADDKAESIVLVFTSGTLAKATSTKITISSGSRKRMIKGVKATVKETSRAMSRHAIRGSRLPATTIPHARLAMTSHPRQPSVVPASEVSSLAACATANGVSAVVGAASLPVRVPAELKASVATYFVARLHADCDVN